MEAKNFTTNILVDKTPAEAFQAIKDLRAWWSEDIEGETDRPGETFFYHYNVTHLAKIRLVEMIADKRLIYQVLANEFSFIKDKTEWVDTKLVFDILTVGKNTEVKFVHEGLVPECECYGVCHNAWTGLIENSLKDLINTGKGQPIPKDGTAEADTEYLNRWRSQH
jgi:hypothetical protein